MSQRDTFMSRVQLALLIMLAVIVATVLVVRTLPVQPSHIVAARVIRLVPIGARFPKMAVVAETSSGITGQTTVNWSDIPCSVGDTIDAVQTGVSLVLKPATCRKALHRSSTSRP